MVKKVLVAMSGGVDSSVAAYMLKTSGYEVAGITLRLFNGGDSCVFDAAKVAAALGIPHYTADLSETFDREVMRRFVCGYEEGLTPNPCVDCNRYIKFGALMAEAEKRGFDYLATGHYARVLYDEVSDNYLLKKALDITKDQSYVLYSLYQEKLARVLFPLGDMTKPEVRRIAERQGLLNADKTDSQDICFVPDGDYGTFIEKYRGGGYPQGDFVNRDGETLGRHRGLIYYTVGQRRGLGIAHTEPLYVLQKNTENNAVVLGEEKQLYVEKIKVRAVNSCSAPLDGLIRAAVKTHYRQQPQAAEIIFDGDTAEIAFDNPQRAVAAGQSAVFYDGDIVLGGGIIC